eukprot:4121471-Alexandrium_andersonii.AAC.1
MLFAVERDAKCQEELLNIRGSTFHIFEDMLAFIPPELRGMCGLDPGTTAQPADVLERHIPRCTLRNQAWCVRHGCLCRLE